MKQNVCQQRRLMLSLTAKTGISALVTGVSLPSKANVPNILGQWSPVYSWPDVGIHLHVLPNGHVFSFSDDDHADGRHADFSKAFAIDIPAGGPPASTWKYIPNTTTNMFCSGHGYLPDGRLIIFGGHEGKDGHGSADVNILDFHQTGNGRWQYVWKLQGKSPMAGGRWYPGAVTLADGSIVVVGGSKTEHYEMNTLPEVWQMPSGGLRALTTARLSVAMYSHLHLAPTGTVFVSGPEVLSRYLDTSGTGRWIDGPPHHFQIYRDSGCSVMFDNGKVLVMGGGNPPTATAETINLKAPVPTWQPTEPMHHARRHHNATLLPDGTVLVTGGTSSPGFNSAKGSVLPAELWNPATGKWTLLASMQVRRVYHSTALLLPDGRVLSAGGGRPGASDDFSGDNRNAEIYSPPYLFRGQRPVIADAPAQVAYGQTFLVNTQDWQSIARVSWLRLPSVSHGSNMNQRINFLPFSVSRGGVFVTAPTSHDRALTPPGHYMLFLLNHDGVPSVSRIIRIG